MNSLNQQFENQPLNEVMIEQITANKFELCSVELKTLSIETEKPTALIHCALATDQGLVFVMEMTYRFDYGQRMHVWIDLNNAPKIVNSQIIDSYGFKLPTHQFKRLAWDVMLHLDMEEVEAELITLLQRRH